MLEHATALLQSDQGPFALLGTLFIGWIAQRNLRKGQHDTREIARDANALKQDQQRFEQNERILDNHREELARLATARESDAERHQRELQRLEDRHQAERTLCAQATRRLHDDLVAVASALRSEVDAATAAEGAERAEHHLHIEHGDDQP
jgi:hypothetical protein